MRSEAVYSHYSNTLEMCVDGFDLSWAEPVGDEYTGAKTAVLAGDFCTALTLAKEVNKDAKFRVKSQTRLIEVHTLDEQK